jgi:hypothetical protein
VYNIVQPSLIFYAADPSNAIGTSIIICPGGSFSSDPPILAKFEERSS